MSLRYTAKNKSINRKCSTVYNLITKFAKTGTQTHQSKTGYPKEISGGPRRSYRITLYLKAFFFPNSNTVLNFILFLQKYTSVMISWAICLHYRDKWSIKKKLHHGLSHINSCMNSASNFPSEKYGQAGRMRVSMLNITETERNHFISGCKHLHSAQVVYTVIE